MARCLFVLTLTAAALASSASHAATITLYSIIRGVAVVDPRGPGPEDDLPIDTGSAAIGFGTFELDTVTNVLHYAVTFTPELLSGPETAALLCGPADSLHAAGAVLPLPLGDYKLGSVDLDQSAHPSAIADFLTGRWYVSIHSAAYPLGEIRGQIEIPEPSGVTLCMLALLSFVVAKEWRGPRENASVLDAAPERRAT